MTRPSSGFTPGAAVVDGVDVDAVAAAVRDCGGVSGLHGGRYGEVATYLPGRTVPGVVVGGGRVRVQVRSRWGVEAPLLAAQITTALAPLTGHHPVDVLIADIDDPPVTPPPRAARRARRAGTPAGPPPARTARV
jgi:hypothetical protein